jgi:hypothetical protein
MCVLMVREMPIRRVTVGPCMLHGLAPSLQTYKHVGVKCVHQAAIGFGQPVTVRHWVKRRTHDVDADVEVVCACLFVRMFQPEK